MGAQGRRLREREGQGLGHKGPHSKGRIHTGDRGDAGGFEAALLGHDARLVSGRQVVLYNTELGNGGRVGEDMQEGKTQESYKTGAGQARRAEGSRVITVPCLAEA